MSRRGARRRQHGRVQALRGRAVVRRARRRGVRRRRAPARRRQRRARRSGDRRGARRRARSTASSSPARPRSGASSRAGCRRARTPGRPSPRWAARTRRSSPPSADLDDAAEGVARAAFGFSGQKCSACSRAIVVDDVHDDLRRAPAARGRRACRSATRPTRDVYTGPVVDARARRALRGGGRRPRERDGAIVAGGGRPDGPGLYVEPTVVSDLPPGHPLTRDELFVPFVTVTRVGVARRGAGRGQRRRLRAHRRDLQPRTRPRSSASSTRSRPASSTSTAARARRPGRGRASSRSAAGSPAARRARAASARTTSRSSCASRAGRSSDRS